MSKFEAGVVNLRPMKLRHKPLAAFQLCEGSVIRIPAPSSGKVGVPRALRAQSESGGRKQLSTLIPAGTALPLLPLAGNHGQWQQQGVIPTGSTSLQYTKPHGAPVPPASCVRWTRHPLPLPIIPHRDPIPSCPDLTPPAHSYTLSPAQTPHPQPQPAPQQTLPA